MAVEVNLWIDVQVNLKEEAANSTIWRTRFGRGYGSVARQMFNDDGDDDDDDDDDDNNNNNNNNNNKYF
jgi:hypothetical protein